MSSSAAAMTATGSRQGTVRPSATIILRRTPLAGASIVLVSLSVSTSKSASPSLTASPSFFFHALSVPSVMVRPSFGITTTFAIANLLYVKE